MKRLVERPDLFQVSSKVIFRTKKNIKNHDFFDLFFLILKFSYLCEYLSSIAEILQKSSSNEYLIHAKFQQQGPTIYRDMKILVDFFYLKNGVLGKNTKIFISL